MATGAVCSRRRNLQENDLEYPLWVFDVDEPSWPRKLSTSAAAPRPARLLGWYAWHWEYGTDIRKFDDGPLKMVGFVDSSADHIRQGRKIGSFLNDIRYDDTFEPGTFRVVFDTDSGQSSMMNLEDWVFDSDIPGYRSDKCITQVKRVWDDVTMWDRESGLDLLSDPENRVYSAHGAAFLVHDDEELMQTMGIKTTDTGDRMRKAAFELTDDYTQVKGMIYPSRTHDNHGLTMRRGPNFKYNRELLVGTALENAPWTDVQRYVRESIGGKT